MILDSFKTHRLIFQIRHANAYILWDRAGEITVHLCKTWPDLHLKEGQPLRQTLVGDRVIIQTGLDTSTVTLSGEKVFETSNILRIKDTFETWRESLNLDTVTRVGTRVQYSKEYPSLREANTRLFSLGLARWPDEKVFDQPIDADRNGLEITYRFEDESSFSVLTIKAEQLKAEVELDSEMFDEPKLIKEKNRLVIDFDRGLLGTVNARKFLVDEWFKGYQHVLHRDIEKIVRTSV